MSHLSNSLYEIVCLSDNPEAVNYTENLSVKYSLSIKSDVDSCQAKYIFVVDDALCFSLRMGGAIGDFSIKLHDGKFLNRLKTASLSQPLAKAVGIKKLSDSLSVFDATAGLGRDGIFLGYLGCNVTMCERERQLFILLNEALFAFKNNYSEMLRGNIKLLCGDSINIMENKDFEDSPEVIYLDPMYPKRKKSSALPKKKLQALRVLVGEGQDDVDSLLKNALEFATKRVVIKRPPEAGIVGGRCDFSIESKLARFDVYLV